MFKFNYISAQPGAGKTTYLINVLAPKFLTQGKNVVVIVPTKNLCDQIAKDSGGIFEAINSDTTPGCVSTTITNIFNSKQSAKAIVITEQVFNNISPRLTKQNWIAIKDEASDPLSIETIRIPDSKRLCTEWLQFKEFKRLPAKESIFFAIDIGEKFPTTSTLDDDITGPLHKLREKITNRYIEVLVDKERFDAEDPVLVYSSFLKPEAYAEFDSVYFMSANFEHTFLYSQWKAKGVIWENKTPVDLITTPIDSSRARFHYWSEEGIWSQYRRSKEDELRNYISWINSVVAGDDYVYSANNNDDELELLRELKGHRIPPISHGLNKWRHYTKFVSCASYLANNSCEPFYQAYGTSTSDVKALRNAQMLYQQITRTDLRNSDSTKPIDIFLPTLSEVLDLLNYLPKAKIIDVNKRSNGQQTGINAVLRSTWTGRDANESDVPPECSYAFGSNVKTYLSTCIDGKEMPNEETEVIRLDLQVGETPHDNNIYINPIFTDLETSRRKRRFVPKRKTHPFIYTIRQLSELSISGLNETQIKDVKGSSLPFFITGVIDHNERFKKENIRGNSDIICFDFDESNLSNKDLGLIFKGIELFKYTTISDKADNELRRFRVVIPCTRTMTTSEHGRLMTYYKSEIESYAKRNKCISGLDTGCLGTERKFFVPHKESEIKHIYDGKSYLDVDLVLSKIRRDPIVRPPTRSDLIVINHFASNTSPHQGPSIVAHLNVHEKIRNKIDSMEPGGRSEIAVQVAGIMWAAGLSDHDVDEYLQQMYQKGIGPEAKKSVNRYLGRR
jgi:hypothetical protein